MPWTDYPWVDTSAGGTPILASVLKSEFARVAAGITYESVKWYGAVGNGVADDTAAIVAAMTAAKSAGGLGGVFFPPGIYITAPIAVPPGIRLQGATAQSYYNATTTVPNVNTQSRLKLKAASTGALISPDDGGTNLATACTIADLALDCNGIAQPAINLPDAGGSISRFWLMENLYITNVGGGSGYSAYVGNQNTACTMRRVIVFNGTSGSVGGYDGIGWYGSDGRMDDCWVGFCAHQGLTLLGGGNDETFVCVGGGVFTCQTGIVIGGGGGVFQGVSIDHNYQDGVYVGTSGPTVFQGCTFHTNSRTTDNTWSNIYMASSGAQLTVTGCRWAIRGGETANNAKYMINTVAGTHLKEFGNWLNPGAAMGTGWTNYGAAAPSAGTWAVGDTVPNNAPTAGGTIGWVCTTAGTPGTWKTYGAIAA